MKTLLAVVALGLGGMGLASAQFVAPKVRLREGRAAIQGRMAKKEKTCRGRCGVFTRFAQATARVSGRAGTFGLAVAVLLIWALTGPIFHFSDTWQLVVNTGTTIVTFLMVFLIQNTQNRDSEALHIKIDELIRSSRMAHNSLLDLENLEEEELDKIRADYDSLAKKARAALEKRKAPQRKHHSNGSH